MASGRGGLIGIGLATVVNPWAWSALGYSWVAPWVLTTILLTGSAFLFVVSVMIWTGLVRLSSPEVAAYFIIGILVVGGVELFARQLPRFTPRPRSYVAEFDNRPGTNFVADERIGWRMKPDHQFVWTIEGSADVYRSDERGFRTLTSSPAATTAEPLVFVGDSFTFGTGVSFEETFAAHLGRDLDLPVRNLAQPGFGVDQMAETLTTEAIPLRPRAIVVAFIDHDLDRCLTAYRGIEGFNKPTFVADGQVLRPQQARDRPPWLLRWFDANSYLWTAMLEVDRRINRHTEWGDRAVVNRLLFERMVEAGRAADVPLLFVRLPLRHPTDQPHWAQVFSDLGASYVDLGGHEPQRPGPIHFDIDEHIDARGHRWIAGALRTAVREATSRSDL